ncbi:ORF329 [White spot syndrome virus]|uniref:Wsv291 n=4 Tax=White spot syndrome virus TaxID=342409 RepID=Q8VAU3_WSSVS|nr:wsv291 [Shrimp white spot syndrome virus]AFX59667.1 wsv291 [White spot syndrome virus]AAL33293.1 wsv291 [Shrimp white spot syndrome virus]ATU83772.1 ORF329 [White spot syndrome virus]AWQ60422.1 wsv291 [Shrimp white spot syndrome virus]AWQ60867.1 wsv291 [Shrimp white spot syndrome virus]
MVSEENGAVAVVCCCCCFCSLEDIRGTLMKSSRSLFIFKNRPVGTGRLTTLIGVSDEYLEEDDGEEATEVADFKFSATLSPFKIL